MLIAGLDFDTAIRGILVVLAGVVLLPGSVYLLLSTNVGARLGFLLAAGGLFGWMFILGITWFLTPPAIGPRGNPPSWEVQEIVYGDPANASHEVLHDLPNVCWSTQSRDCEPVEGTGTEASAVLADNPDFVAEVGEEGTMSEIENVEPGNFGDVEFGDWNLIPLSEAGEGVSAADEELRAQGIFEASTQYLVLDAWQQGGKEPLPADPDRLDRIWYKIRTTVQLRHPTHYQVVQIQPVVPVTPVPGEAPPPPTPDPNQPTITILMVRDLGNLRVPAALVTLGSGLMLGVTAYALHRRDELVAAHRAEG